MTTQELFDRAEQLAEELIDYANGDSMTAEELVHVTVCAQRLLQRSCFRGDPLRAREAAMVAHATFDAVTQTLDTN